MITPYITNSVIANTILIIQCNKFLNFMLRHGAKMLSKNYTYFKLTL
jgi:hypothetical protein